MQIKDCELSPESDRYVLILLAREEQTAFWLPVMGLLERYGLFFLSRRSLIASDKGNTDLSPVSELQAWELLFCGCPSNLLLLHQDLIRYSQQYGIDLSLQTEVSYRTPKKLACFDMDSTLIKTEVMDELAECAGVGAYVRQITERAMNGEFDFKESFRQRLRLLQGLDEHVLQEIADRLPLMDGLETLLQGLKHHGCKVAILSGGFTYFALRLKEMFHLDYVYANQLEIRDGRLTGKHLDDIVDSSRKVALLKELSQKEQITLNETLAVGDGANDLAMLQTAGLGIAYHAKKKVRDHIPQSINITGLDGILYFLGYSPAEL